MWPARKGSEMAREKFKDYAFKPASLALIKQCNEIIEDYLEQGFRLTLRQLYYQLVSRNIVPNTEKSYKNVGKMVSEARLAGMMDWEAIEDRVRVPKRQSEFTGLGDLVKAALYSYRLPRWKTQECYAELWVEKDALAGVLAPLAKEFHVTLMVNKGYSSQSAMYESANRFIEGTGQVWYDDAKTEAHRTKDGFLFYLGDHDPSGEDMVRDIRDRLEMFGVRGLEVRKLALTMDQIEQYSPPPNPAKVSDPRADKYIALHGDSSWEVDALPPDVLAKIIRGAFEEIIDRDAMDEILAKEEADKKALTKAVKALGS
jgi:hypothetical protein